MTTTYNRTHQRHLLQIVIGAAWADRHLEPAEVGYLQQLAARYGLAEDAELQELLTTPVPVPQTEHWLVAYLQETSPSERQRALVAIANLFMADDEVAEIEHALLDEFHRLSERIPAKPEPHPKPHSNDSHPSTVVIQGWLQKLGNWVRTSFFPPS